MKSSCNIKSNFGYEKIKMYLIAILALLLVVLMIFLIKKKYKKENFEGGIDETNYNFPKTKIIEHSTYGKIKCFDNKDYVCDTILSGKIWEENLYNDIFKKYIKENVTIIDCGAFIGSHTILLSKLNQNNNVIGFEMMPEHYKLLVDNIKLNNLSNVIVFNSVLDDKLGTQEIPNQNYNIENTNLGGTTLSTEKSNIKIPALTLDYIIPFINESKPGQFIKMDIEGHEINCLNGSKILIEKFKPLILIEIWKNVYDNFINNDIWKYMESFEYKIKHVNGDDYLLYIPKDYPDIK
jgi:FkbM family methyltransferase